MTITVKVGEAKTHLSQLIAKVERGEEFIIARGNQPVARLVPLDSAVRGRMAIQAILALRDSGRIKPVTQAEIAAWKHEGHKY